MARCWIGLAQCRTVWHSAGTVWHSAGLAASVRARPPLTTATTTNSTTPLDNATTSAAKRCSQCGDGLALYRNGLAVCRTVRNGLAQCRNGLAVRCAIPPTPPPPPQPPGRHLCHLHRQHNSTRQAFFRVTNPGNDVTQRSSRDQKGHVENTIRTESGDATAEVWEDSPCKTTEGTFP